MAFLASAYLWWLLPVVGAIVFLYLLKMKRVDVRVPAVFLWPKRTADVRANAPIQKLRFSWLLVLQLLAALLIIAAAANPVRKSNGLNGTAVAIVLDGSASMGSVDSSESRFDQAKSKILAQISNLNDSDHCAIIEAGTEPRIICPLSADKTAMRSGLNNCEQTDSDGSMGDALRLAAALVGERSGGRIVVYSDGAFAPVKNFSPGKADVVFVKVGSSGRNAAVVALDATDIGNGIEEVFASLHNYDTVPVRSRIVVTADNRIIDARDVTIPAGQSIGQQFHTQVTTNKISVHLKTPGDILAADDKATLYLQGASTIRTLLISSGNLFLEKALALEPSVKLDRTNTVPANEAADGTGPSPYDLVIFDGPQPTAVRAPAVWSFGGGNSVVGVTPIGSSHTPHVISWNRQSPILRYMDLRDILVEQSTRVRTLPESEPLVNGSDGPLITEADTTGRRSLFVGWNLLDSDFPLRLSFPIFVDNAVTWLTRSGSGTVAGGLNVHPGQIFVLPAPSAGSTLVLSGANGRRQGLKAVSGGVTVTAPDRVGEYTITGPNYRKEIAVNLLDQDESDVTPRDTLRFAGKTVSAQRLFTSLAEMWRPLVIAVMILLAAEWWLFVRKS